MCGGIFSGISNAFLHVKGKFTTIEGIPYTRYKATVQCEISKVQVVFLLVCFFLYALEVLLYCYFSQVIIFVFGLMANGCG